MKLQPLTDCLILALFLMAGAIQAIYGLVKGRRLPRKAGARSGDETAGPNAAAGGEAAIATEAVS